MHEDCEQVLASIRKKRRQLLDLMKDNERQFTNSFEKNRPLMRDHAELIAAERAMLEYRSAHPV